jgi:hypothetical protein
MFHKNEWRHSDIVPDRLYNCLPDFLREIVDSLRKLLSPVGYFEHGNVYSKFIFVNRNETVFDETENLSSQVKEYILEEDRLPFAYVYVAKFILKRMNKVLCGPY